MFAAAKLNEYWSHPRMTDPELIGRSLLKSGHGSFPRNSQIRVSTGSEQQITLSEALETYITLSVLESQRPLKLLSREPVVIL